MEYPLDDFISHFQALYYVGKYDTADIAFFGVTKTIDLSQLSAEDAMLAKVRDYMEQCYSDEPTRAYIGYRLARVIDYFRIHHDAFAASDLVTLDTQNGTF